MASTLKFVVVMAMVVTMVMVMSKSVQAVGTFPLQVSEATPMSASVFGGDEISIRGRGFERYSQAQCSWHNNRWYSHAARIINDALIVCETPIIDEPFLSDAPFTTDIAVLFDGDESTRISISLVFRFGPKIDSITPDNGITQGGNYVTIIGSEFDGYSSIEVTFDGAQCLEVAVLNEGTVIRCKAPAGKFNQNAAIDVKFDGHLRTTVRAPTTYHYGPEISTIVPRCGRLTGSTLVTLTGVNLNDPLIYTAGQATTGNVVVEVYLGSSVYTSPSATFDGNQIQFITPSITNVDSFGQSVTIGVIFQKLNSRVVVSTNGVPIPFFYGPVLYTASNSGPYNATTFLPISPADGHRGGGDSITLFGCGFSAFSRAQLRPLVDLNGTPVDLCVRGAAAGGAGDTLQVVPGTESANFDRIVCTAAAIDCTAGSSSSLTRTVTLTVTPNLPAPFSTSYTLPSSGSLSYTPGPQITSVSPTDGFYRGGETVSINGKYFFSTVSARVWAVRVLFNTQIPSIGVISRTGNIASDSLITVVTPTNIPWGANVILTIEFFDRQSGAVFCTNLPRGSATTLSFHSGPVCSSVSPSSGSLSGGELVTITGSGFLRGRTDPVGTTDVRICITRLNSAFTLAGTGTCATWEPVSRLADDFQVTENTIVFRVPDIRQNVRTLVGGNRLFGDQAIVAVAFTDTPNSALAPNITQPVVACGTYRFGPVVTGVALASGPNGPRSAVLSSPGRPGSPVVVLGTNFDDIIYSENVRIDIENINALPSYVVDAGDGFDSTTVRGLTRWGGTVGVQPLTVTFDTCNTTMSSSIISWGPTITRLLGPAGRVPATSTHNPNGDVWGVLPNGGQQITVIGQGFDEFTTGRIRCVVDGSVVATSAVTNIDGGQQVVCTLPARPFATEAQVKLEFARAPCTDLEWLDSVIAKQVVHYEPRIERFSPDFGPTSGNTEVTITGEGFIGWPNFLCHFGHYSTGISAVVAADGTSLTCRTPDQRGEFNTDVRVHVLLGAGAAQAHYRVWAEELFHYGPFCTGVTPTVGLLAGGYDVTLAGIGFQDCVDSNSTHIRNCTFRSFKVHMQDGVTSQDLWVSPVFDSLALGNTDAAYINITLPSNNACNNARKFVIEYLDPVVTRDAQRFISCPSTAVGTFLYGPLFLSQTSEFHRLSTSYGWESTQVTITGERFHDPNIYNSDENIICAFGGIPGTIVTPTTDTTIVCAAPAGAWNTLVNITLEWTAIGVTCGGSQAVTAGKFHYGPVIDAITPKRGYVAGGTPVTVSGFALTCCGINDVKCVYPLEDSVAEFTSTTAKCNVPTNTFIDRQINNIGLRFGSVSFPTNSLSLTEARTSLTYYYGPIITNVQPVRARLSGKNQAITITGEGFADPYFTATYCDFLAEDQANPSSIGNVNVAGATPSDTQIVCPIVPYSHPCGAVDFVRPRWARNCSFVCEHRSELGNNYYKTVNRNPTIEAKERLPFYSDSGSTEPLLTTVEYGPAIVSVTTARGPAPSASPSETLRSFTSGGLVVTVKGDDFGDWIADNNRLDFGTQKAVCLFGDRRSAPATINADSTVVCTVPKGAVGESGPIGITLDPHFDSATQSTYRWLPHVSGISRPWALSRSTGEALIVRGGGFCSFSSVTCLFGNDLFGVSDGPGVIVNDHTVECVPPSRQPGVVNVYLLFCDPSFTTGSCLELPVAEQQRVLVTREFTFVGLTDLSPNELPTCADTRITLLGNGFSNFDSFRCIVGDQVVPAQRISDSALQCLAPHLPLSDMFHPVTCHSVKVIATSNGQSALLEAPITVEYGVPEVLQVEPSTSDVDDTVEVYVFGQYFRGGDVDGTYMCRFGDITVPGKLTFREVFIDDELELLEAVACIAPNLDTHPDLREGTVYIEVSFNCPDLTFDDPSGYVFTSNRFSYTFTQNPSITAMSPTEGLEVGGTEVTLFGGNFLGGSRYFCSFGTLDSNNDATDNQNQLVSARLIPEGVVESRFSPVVVCLTPANYLDTDTAVDVHLTIDTGKSFIKSPQRFTYLNVGKVVCEARQSSSTASPLALPSMWSALVALAVTMMFALLA